MSPDLGRIARWLVLCGYLFTITAANCFHQHGGDHHPASLLAQCCHGPDGDGDGRCVSRGDSCSCGEELCVVCRFLSQNAARVQCLQDVSVADVYESLHGITPLRFLSQAPLVERSRDPPFVV
jgi:hypothetical protein